MGLKFSYTLLAPIYDFVVSNATQSMRISSIQRMDTKTPQSVLINGIGTGLDIPFLPKQHNYTGTDLTPAMLDRCKDKLKGATLNLHLHNADAMKLPFADNQFDIVLMNLILAVVPEPLKALQEAIRVAKPQGKIYIMDKFIPVGKLAIFRRLLNLTMQHIATRTDIVFEPLLKQCPQAKLLNDSPALLNGWFRLIDLEKLH
jgi:phosphatidylethanolamine/phosphatidyl-N-methylethanolamine N-methyltransferase